jgi:hypothetical protein
MPTPLCSTMRAQIFGLLLGLMLSTAAAAQSSRTSPPPARQDWAKIDEELKGLLSDYYTGKPVRAKVVIPAAGRGLEIVDGEMKAAPVADLNAAAQPGDLLLIKQVKFSNRSIEIRFDGGRDEDAEANRAGGAPQTPPTPALAPVGAFGSEASDAVRKDGKNLTPRVAPPAARSAPAVSNNTKPQTDPRVTLRFSREISTRDLNLQSINRLLAAAVDVTELTPKEAAPQPDTAAQAGAPDATRPAANDAATLAERAAAAQGVARANITGDIVTPQPNVSELSVECSVAGARLYIDGAFSGSAPRTVRLLAGVHTVLIAAPGYESWEQRFFIPPGKAAAVRAQLRPAPKQ